MKSKSLVVGAFLAFVPAMSFAWNSQNTHQPLATRSMELLGSDYKDVKTNFADVIVSGTGNSNIVLALAVEFDSHGNPTLNGGSPSDIWENRVVRSYKDFNFTDAYYALGNIVHLTQDQAVPPHGANVSHGPTDHFESSASGIINVIQLRGSVSGITGFPYEYYGYTLNGTWAGAENWRSIVGKNVDNYTIPSGTRFWVRNSSPGAAAGIGGRTASPPNTNISDNRFSRVKPAGGEVMAALLE